MKAILLAGTALLFSGAAWAQQDPGEALDPAALLREAEENSPSIRAAAARLDAARSLRSQAEAPADPEVSLAYTNDGLSQFTLGESEFANLSLSWTQEIRTSGKRRLSGRVADRGAEAAAKELERTRLEVLSAVKGAYSDLLRLDRAAGILSESRGVLLSLEESSRRRYEVGQGIQENVLKAQTEIMRLEAESTRLSQERGEAEARLLASVGREVAAPLGPAEIDWIGEVPGDTEALAESAVESSPEVGALQAEVRRSEASVELARREQKPDYIWSAAYQYRGSLDPMVMGMFGVRLPLYKDRKQAQAVAQAEADLVAQRSLLAQRRVQLRSRVRELCARVRSADRLLEMYLQGIVPQAANTLKSAQSSYSAGRAGFLDVMSDLKLLLDARREIVSLQAERARSLAALEPLLGRELLHTPGPAGRLP